MRKKFTHLAKRHPCETTTAFPAPTWLREDLKDFEKIGSGRIFTLFHDDLPEHHGYARTESFCRKSENFFRLSPHLIFQQSDLRRIGHSPGGIYVSNETHKRTPQQPVLGRPANSAIMLYPQAIKPSVFLRSTLLDIAPHKLRPQQNININRIIFLHEAGHHVQESNQSVHPSPKQNERNADRYALSRVSAQEARFWISFRALNAQLCTLEEDDPNYWNVLSLSADHKGHSDGLSDLNEAASVIELKLQTMGHPLPQSNDPKVFLKNYIGEPRAMQPQTYFMLVSNAGYKAIQHLQKLATLDPASFVLPHTHALFERTLQAIDDITPGILKEHKKRKTSYHDCGIKQNSRSSAPQAFSSSGSSKPSVG